jgi:hypothetical protein
MSPSQVHASATKEAHVPSKITQFTAPVVRSVRSDLEHLLQDFAGERGLKVELDGNGSYTAGDLRATLTLRTPAHAQQVDTRKAAHDEAVASILGLPPDIVGQAFAFQRSLYKVIEIHAGRPKYPITAERVPDGKRFKFPAHAVLSGLKKAG